MEGSISWWTISLDQRAGSKECPKASQLHRGLAHGVWMASGPRIGVVRSSFADSKSGHTRQSWCKHLTMANGAHDSSYRFDCGRLQYHPYQQTPDVRIHSPGRT